MNKSLSISVWTGFLAGICLLLLLISGYLMIDGRRGVAFALIGATSVLVAWYPIRRTSLGFAQTVWARPYVSATLIALVAFALYFRSLSFGFVWDDHVQITHNPLIRSWTGLPAIFTHHFGVQQTTEIRYYRPLLNVWQILLFKLFNLRPSGWHLMTVLLHVAATTCVYSMARLLRFRAPVAFFAALLFAVHPVHIESACWISGGGDSMLTIFCVLSFIAFLQASQTSDLRRWLWLISSWVFLLLALLTKETAIVFFAVVFTFAWTHPELYKRGRVRSAMWTTLWYAVVTLAYVLGRKLALRHLVQFHTEISVQKVLVTLPTVLVHDFRLLVWPVGLNSQYYVPYVTELGINNFLLPLLLLAAIVVLIAFWARKQHDSDVIFLAFWIILTLTPTLYLPVLRSGDFVRDRYLYLPSVAFVLLLAKLLELFPWRKAAVGIAAVLIILGITGSFEQQKQWASDLSLFERGFRLNPGGSTGVNYAIALMAQREYARAKDVLEKDMVPLYGNEGPVSTALAICYGKLGEFTQGDRELRRAIDTDSWDVSVGVKTSIAMAYEALNQYPAALTWLQDVLRESPEYLSAITETAYAYERMGNLPEADSWYRRSLALDPYDSDTLFQFGHMQIARGQVIEGEERIRLAIELGPVARGYHEELAKSLAARGEKQHAIAEFKRELEVSPWNNDAQQLLSGLLRVP